MTKSIIDTTVAAGAGGVSGWAVASLSLRNSERKRRRSDSLDARPFPEASAEAAAREWASRSHSPEAAPLILNKLRLGWHLHESRRRDR